MKTLRNILGVLAAVLIIINLCEGQTNDDSKLAARADSYLKKANVMNGVTIGFGLASNIEMIIIGGFPLELDDGGNPAANLTHMVFGVGRITTSIFPPIFISRARHTLKPLCQSPETAASFKRLSSCLDAAQILSALAPVMCVSGGAMMIYASCAANHHEYNFYDEYQYKTKDYHEIKTIGWVLVGAGLAASISSAVLVSISRHELDKKFGSFRLSASPAGVGVKYNLKVRH